MTTYNFAQLQQLWVQAGGPAAIAPLAAAVALAESGGRSDAIGTNSNGSTDRGLWQINNQAHPGVSDACAADPICNARSAISISNAGTNWRPWCTAWSDNACGSKGGTYLGVGSSAMGIFASHGGVWTPQAGGGATGVGIPASQSVGAGPDPNACAIGFPGVAGVGKFCVLTHGQLRQLGGGLLMVAGGAVMLVGTALLLRQSGTAQKASQTIIALVPGGRAAASRSPAPQRPAPLTSQETSDLDQQLASRAPKSRQRRDYENTRRRRREAQEREEGFEAAE